MNVFIQKKQQKTLQNKEKKTKPKNHQKLKLVTNALLARVKTSFL